MLAAHKIALDLNNKQKTYMAKAVGCARFAYNWALAEWQSMYQAWKTDSSQPKPNQYVLRKRLNAIKRERFPWMLEVTKCAVQEAIIHLGRAFDRFFRHQAKYPRRHKKGINESFTISSFAVNGKRLRVPNLGWVRMVEFPRFDGAIKSVTISRTADRWFTSLLVETSDNSVRAENQGEITGCDLGIKTLLTLADGTKIEAPKPLGGLLKKLKRLQRSLSRKRKGGRNRAKARMRLARLHARIANIRNDFLHKLTTWLAKRYSVIGIEDLNVSDMLKNHHLARAIADLGFYAFRRMLEYKCGRYGSKLVL